MSIDYLLCHCPLDQTTGHNFVLHIEIRVNLYDLEPNRALVVRHHHFYLGNKEESLFGSIHTNNVNFIYSLFLEILN